MTAQRTVGVPTEIKESEYRVAVTPDGVRELVAHGVAVLVQKGAGDGAAFSDSEYADAGAELVDDRADVWARATTVVKVKEPQEQELELLRPGLELVTFLHLAAYPRVAAALVDARVTAVAYETVQLTHGELPLLAPMSEVAGRMSIQVGARLLERHHDGRGVLLGGVAGVAPAQVVVLGGGTVGWNAARIAAGMEAEVRVLDRDLDRLRHLDQVKVGRVTTLAANRGSVERAVLDADLVIGAVLVAGDRAPTLVTEDVVARMKRGAVVIDIAIDQGGCIETSHETTHEHPTFVVHDVVHYAVGNMPGAVPHTATHALTNATLPYVTAIATAGVREAAHVDPALALGVNTMSGLVVNAAVAHALPDLPSAPFNSELIGL
ncbi:MAG: alanine dehydrogenase [Acidimicrobiia bacterium]|nr:alanine dehydrogenase [Acidimicrobiia bacterium]